MSRRSSSDAVGFQSYRYRHTILVGHRKKQIPFEESDRHRTRGSTQDRPNRREVMREDRGIYSCMSM